jgi:hypothetical protein
VGNGQEPPTTSRTAFPATRPGVAKPCCAPTPLTRRLLIKYGLGTPREEER